MSNITPEALAAPTRKYRRAVSPRLKKLLYVVFALVAVLTANSLYLASITALGHLRGESYENVFYMYMFGLHLVLGLILLVPFLVFGILHMLAARHRRNRRAVKIGYLLFAIGIVVLASGIVLVRIPGLIELKHELSRSAVYWLHIICPAICLWMYWLHRLSGPRIKWRVGVSYLGVVGTVVLAMVVLQSQDPRSWYQVGSKDGVTYFEPSKVRTPAGLFIPERALLNNDYCMKCHPDAYDGWFHSVHHFSSFNNPAYLAAIRETREVALKRDGDVKASRWCAGCHDPVPFLSGKFDDPEYDLVNDPTSQAGITCTVCHSITHINNPPIGNADFVIEEPLHYPFAYSQNSILQFINNTLVKAKPAFHKKSMLKPFHKTAEFCAACHKVHLPKELNHYREFLRGQNHYDAYLLSGVSGHGASSFYYPPQAVDNCSKCHMPLQASNDFGARTRSFEGTDQSTIHGHLFPSANTGVAWLNSRQPGDRFDKVIQDHQNFLDGAMRVDIFGVKEGGVVDGELHAPLRPAVPTLSPGRNYLLETVIRTMKLGHLFTQGTVDSNEVWLEVTVSSGGQVIGRNGGMDGDREVDPWSHFVNVFLLDREGNRIARRNPQDIFVPLYNNQIPPGAGQTVHYELRLPPQLKAPVTVEIKLNYRKFDKQYMDFVARAARPGDHPIRGLTPGEKYLNELPVTVLATDRLTFPVAGSAVEVTNAVSKIPPWQRWNDYGIGLLLKGKAELRQAADAFREVEKLGRYDGSLNLARVLLKEGRNDEAVAALRRSSECDDPAPPSWTLAWLTGMANRQQGRLPEAAENFRSVVEDITPEMRQRGFDFGLDYRVVNLLGITQFDLATREFARGESGLADGRALLEEAITTFHKVLAIDSENVTAHYNLHRAYAQLEEQDKAEEHRVKHQRYKPDDNARDRAVGLARKKYPAADRAANSLVVYLLNRKGAPELDEAYQFVDPQDESP